MADEAKVQADTAQVNEPTKYATTAGGNTGEYVTAKTDLFFHGIRAHAAGSRVPVANVERNGWSNQVEQS